MQTVSRIKFTTVKTEGAILPADLLQRVADGRDLDGLKPADYHLAPNERLNEAINRSWNRCLGVWQGFNEQREVLPSADKGTSLTRERWLLILFQELGYGRLPYEGSLPLGPEDDAPRYPISHHWGHAPIHLVAFRQDLDHRDPSNKSSPHSLMQEFLNRSDESLWGFLSNGLRLRVLRDNVSLTRAAYVEFDLEAMMAGELYADFVLLWLVCHQSRVEADPPAECWLERWSKSASEQGVRALDTLRDGVREAIVALGRGFLAHRANSGLKASLQAGALSAQDYYRQLLRLVYRLIFLFVAEDRELLLQPGTPHEIQRRYTEFYSVRRLRDMAETLRGGPHADLYRCLSLVCALLRDGYPPLALPALGSFLFSERATSDLDNAELANGALLEAVRALAFTIEGKVRRPVDYRNLGAEELGSVYESLLELHPQLNADAASFDLHVAAGSERKTTGSYYTDASLIHCLLDSALEPVLADRLAQALPEAAAQEAALLDIRVVDPACGSGHFLIGAAHRLARHLARVRTGDEEPAPAELRAALRDVVRHCIHGVDINPMAVELCKVALWMETLDPGKPLSFLDRNIQCGNSLVGATPALLTRGIPDEAFQPITGDDKAYCGEWRTRNKQQRESEQLSLLAPDLRPWDRLGNLAADMMDLDDLGDDTLEGVRRQQEIYESLVRSSGYSYGRKWADAWCAAFFWKKTKEFAYPITEEVFRQIERNPFDIPQWMAEEIDRLREQYGFFHWHLAFPHVLSMPPTGEEAENEQTGCNGGFDIVLGNPPWEMIQMDPREFFSVRAPEIAGAPSMAARNEKIAQLEKAQRVLHQEFLEAKRLVDGLKHFAHHSAHYPLASYGRVNMAPLFAELVRQIVPSRGRAGIIVPTTIATTSFSQFYFADLLRTETLISLYDFENREGMFPSVHREQKFCLLTIAGEAPIHGQDAQFVFFAHRVEDLKDKERLFAMSASEIALLNPNTRTCPIFRTKRDAELNKAIYRRLPVLVNETLADKGNPWGFRGFLMFMMNTASGLFHIREQLEREGWCLEGNVFRRFGESYVPLYEGKLTQIFDHRFATFADVSRTQANKGNPRPTTEPEHSDSSSTAIPRFWISDSEFHTALPHRVVPSAWLTFHDIANPNNERTFIATICPPVAMGNTLPAVASMAGNLEAESAILLCANWNSFVLDYVSRLKIASRHLNFFVVKQLAVLPPSTYEQCCDWSRGGKTLRAWLSPRALELTCTSWDLQPFAQDCGYDGPPFRWDEERRFLLRCELDAAYFHLYSIERDDVDYIMDTFPIVKRRDEAAHGDYRTKRVILEIYDEMQRAVETGQPYQTRLDPPPADPRVAHPDREASS